MPRVRLCVLWQRCALRRAEGLGGEICHAAGDMRAVARREGERGDKKNALPRDIGILLFFNFDLFNLIFHCQSVVFRYLFYTRKSVFSRSHAEKACKGSKISRERREHLIKRGKEKNQSIKQATTENVYRATMQSGEGEQ